MAFTGVAKVKGSDLFAAQVKAHGKVRYLGAWTEERDAAVARDRAVLWLGLDTPLQLPRESRALGACSPEDLRRLAMIQRRTARGESRFRGVSWNGALESWRAWIRVNGEIACAEGFESEEEAALAYDRLAIGLGAERSRLNFPDRPQAPITLDALRKELRARRKGQLTSMFRGVSRAPGDRWGASIQVERRVHRLGKWLDEVDAAEAYDRAALFFFGDAATRNFPDRPLVPTAPADLCAEQRAATKATMTSRYRGVSWVQRSDGRGTWMAFIKRDGPVTHLGNFDDERDAAIAHDRVARAWFGDAAPLNFPDELWPATSVEELRAENRARFKETTTSRYQGVSWVTSRGAWRAEIDVDGVHYALGYYDDEDEAGRAYDRKRWELRGEGPYNFPDELPAAKVRARRARR